MRGISSLSSNMTSAPNSRVAYSLDTVQKGTVLLPSDRVRMMNNRTKMYFTKTETQVILMVPRLRLHSNRKILVYLVFHAPLSKNLYNYQSKNTDSQRFGVLLSGRQNLGRPAKVGRCIAVQTATSPFMRFQQTIRLESV